MWATTCLTLSRLPVFLFLFVPYHVATVIVLAGTVLLFIGSIPAALAILKGRGEEAPVFAHGGRVGTDTAGHPGPAQTTE